MKKWETRFCASDSHKDVMELLAGCWEPFAVDAHVMYFKREVQTPAVVKDPEPLPKALLR